MNSKLIKKILILVFAFILITFGLFTNVYSQDNNDNGENNNDSDDNHDENGENDNEGNFLNDFDEDDFFGDNDEELIEEVDEDDLQNDISAEPATGDDIDYFTIGGSFKSSVNFILRESDIENSPFEYSEFTTTLNANFNIDFQLEDFLIGHADFDFSYTPSYFSFALGDWVPDRLVLDTSRLSLDIRSSYVRAYTEFKFSTDIDLSIDTTIDEMFLDINANNKVFFRIGKQDIKWGAGYRWSPTDFLNEERIDPLDPDEDINYNGISGFKITVPVDRFNFISFIGNESLMNVLDPSIALRLEFAYDFFEVTATAYYQKNIRPLFGADFSGGGEFWYGTWDFWAESSFSLGSNRTFVGFDETIELPESKFYTYTADKDVPYVKAVIGLSYETVILPEILTTNLMITVEYLYNGEGYSDKDLYAYAIILEQTSPDKLYQPYQMGKHYIAAGLSLSNIFSDPEDYSDINFSSNYIMNLSDFSSVLGLSISYSGIDDLRASIGFNFYFADEGTEFFFNNPYVVSQFLKNLNTILDPITQEITGYDMILSNIFTLNIELSYNF